MKPGFWFLTSVVALAGCTSPFVRSQSPEANDAEPSSQTRLVGDLAVAYGMHPIKVEGVALVTGLAGTGSDPEPSPQRDELMTQLKAHGVNSPHQLLASSQTSLVVMRGFLRPGIQAGDRFDVEVRTSSRSGTTSLQGGWLMESDLTELAVLQGSIREGSRLALAKGPLMVDPAADGEDSVAGRRARVLGGGVALRSRPLALVLKPDHQNVAASASIGTAVNRRFHTFRAGVKLGVANPKDDQHVELIVHPRYKDNVARYMQVVRSIPIRENAAQQAARMALLERQLLDPITAATAALRLEALGKDSAPILLKGLESPDSEVRFYAAEALAYLDHKAAADPLAQIARDVPAFRAFALAALSAMDEFAAYDALRDMLDASSNETRYGAFRSLWAMNANDPLVRGEELRKQFHLHVIDSEGPPLIHLTRSYRPEIVLFGTEHRLTTPFVLEAGKRILVNSANESVTVSRFAPNEPDQQRVVSQRLDDCIRAIVNLGGTYPDVVQFIQQAKAKGVLDTRLAIDAVPTGNRSYARGATRPRSDVVPASAEESVLDENLSSDLPPAAEVLSPDGDALPSDSLGQDIVVASPVPGLFDAGSKSIEETAPPEAAEANPIEPVPVEATEARSKPTKRPRPARSWLVK